MFGGVFGHSAMMSMINCALKLQDTENRQCHPGRDGIVCLKGGGGC